MMNSFAAAAAASSNNFLPDHPHPQRRGAVVCPKPRRVGHLNDPSRPLRWQLSHQAELSDSKAGPELLDIILSKGGHGSERSGTNNSSSIIAGSSPPYFCGSPPNRVSNPLIQDVRFREEKLPPSNTTGYPMCSPVPPPLSPTSAAARKGGCVRASFGNNPAVRIEGFDCLDRDRSRNCSIPALA